MLNKISSKTLLLLLLILITLCLLSLIDRAHSSAHESQLHIWGLDIGQGDAILLETPDHKFGLIDGGRGSVVLEQLREVMGDNKRLNFVLSTHPDADHSEGLLSVLDYYQVDNLLLVHTGTPAVLFSELKQRAANHKVMTYDMRSDNDFRLGCCVDFDVLWPAPNIDFKRIVNINDTSLTVLVKYKSFTMFSGGDLGHEYESIAASSITAPVKLLKVGHHGSANSSRADFLAQIKPEYALISVGKDNSYGHPRAEVITALTKEHAQIYRTDQDSRVEFITDGEKSLRVCKLVLGSCEEKSI